MKNDLCNSIYCQNMQHIHHKDNSCKYIQDAMSVELVATCGVAKLIFGHNLFTYLFIRYSKVLYLPYHINITYYTCLITFFQCFSFWALNWRWSNAIMHVRMLRYDFPARWCMSSPPFYSSTIFGYQIILWNMFKTDGSGVWMKRVGVLVYTIPILYQITLIYGHMVAKCSTLVHKCM